MTDVHHHSQILSTLLMPGPTWNPDPPNLSLPHSWDDRRQKYFKVFRILTHIQWNTTGQNEKEIVEVRDTVE
jgi:hypothetical protein